MGYQKNLRFGLHCCAQAKILKELCSLKRTSIPQEVMGFGTVYVNDRQADVAGRDQNPLGQ
jgi:hypothetical protein